VLRAGATALCRQLSELAVQAAPPVWLAAWQAEEQRAAQLAALDPPLEAAVVQTILARLPDGAILFSGNSMAIRELDAYSGSSGAVRRILANRGASGIDGNVSTALGLAAGSGQPVLALLGDLTFYHDMNGLAAARGLDVVFVVLNNGGGGIFSYLPQTQLEEFEHAWLTPLNLDFSHAAALYGLAYHRVAGVADFSAVLAEALGGGAHLVEVMLDREASVIRHQAYWAAVAAG
jgi:2-succinyl-5-enolpyruvyl-6-hydroxy-3-cyclohexene-1-carboxylate synthase